MEIRELGSRQLPSNFGPLKGADGQARVTGPCGDTMEFWLRIEGERIRHATFTSDGCMHSIACASAAAFLAEGKTLAEGLDLGHEEVLKALGHSAKEWEHCALLAVNVLKAAIGESVRGGAKPRKETPRQAAPDRIDELMLKGRLSRIARKILVLSGKGGVGKSTVAVNLATALSQRDLRVGLLDVDMHGPTVPRMLGISNRKLRTSTDAILPEMASGLKVMSIGLLLTDPNEAVIWRGPKKMSLIRQFLRDVDWGTLDALVIDLPPGTGDEPLSVCQLIPDADGAVIVTTPQDAATSSVRRSVTFCRQVKLPVIGVVENMSGFVCPHCSETTEIFRRGGGELMAGEMDVPFLGRIPLDPAIGRAGEEGVPVFRKPEAGDTTRILDRIATRIVKSS
jgi:Mrp family chromosome partitioning ATPase